MPKRGFIGFLINLSEIFGFAGMVWVPQSSLFVHAEDPLGWRRFRPFIRPAFWLELSASLRWKPVAK
jgi:hypothetical protein